jgi:two-component system response regulator RegX3
VAGGELTDRRAPVRRDPARVLIVEDDEASRTALARGLEHHGFAVLEAADGSSALQAYDPRAVDLIVLDVGLPDMDGFSVLTTLRQRSDVPVVMLSGRAEEVDRVVGLELGADDYVVKPYSLRELVARIGARLRGRSRQHSGPTSSGLVYGSLRLERRAREVYLNGAQVQLTAREYELLAFLLSHPRQVFSREELLEQVWGTTYQDPATVTEHVRRVRTKLGNDHRIATLRGVGYRFDP